MKTIELKRYFYQALGILSLAMLALTNSYAAGILTPKGQSTPLEIRDHQVEVTIEDGYAVTSVEQVFHNAGSRDLEAIYSFPVPHKASVGEFTYWIDGKPVHAEILKKGKARQIHEQEKAAGRETALVEKDEYRTFDITVYPVRAGQDVRIRLVYLQSAAIDTGMGRYVYPLEEGGVDDQKMAFWSHRDEVSRRFSFDLNLRSGYPVDGVRLPDHPQALITQGTDGTWKIQLGDQPAAEEGQPAIQAANKARLDKDVVVYWRHKPGLPGSVDLVAYRPDAKGRGTFALTITPGDDLKPIIEGRDWAFVLDISGSMSGKLHTLIEGVKQGLQKLGSQDRFRIILFNNNATEFTSGYITATPENVTRILEQMAQIRSSGGTNLYAGLKLGIDSLDADRTSAVILVTDGVANVGVTEKKRFLSLLEKRDLRLFTFIMGNSANRPLLQGMTKVSNGFAASISNSDDILGQIMLATSKVTHEALHDVEIKIKGVKVTDLTPDQMGSLYRGQQLVMFGHYWGEGTARIEVSGKISGEQKIWQTSFDFPKQADLNPEIERFWAFGKIQHLKDQMDYLGEDADSKDAITDLATEFGLVTDYTSMLVVREEVFTQKNIQRNNHQRVQKEQQARKVRRAQPVKSNRVDTKKPMYQSKRANLGSGGAGALGPWSLLMLLPLVFIGRRRAQS